MAAYETREQYEEILASLQEADSNFVEVPHQVDILQVTEKAICIEIPNGEFSSKQLWFPKSQVGYTSHGVMGNQLCVKRWWLSSKRLWWVTK